MIPTEPSTSLPPIRQSCTFRPTIRGWCTAIRFPSGQVGTNIPVSGLVVLTYRSGLDSELDGTEDSDGDGATGDSIGTIAIRCSITSVFIRGAGPSITATLSIVAACAAAASSTGRALAQGPMKVAVQRRGAGRNRAARAACAPAHSASTIMAVNRAAIRPAANPASTAADLAVGAEDSAVADTAAAAVVNRSFSI